MEREEEQGMKRGKSKLTKTRLALSGGNFLLTVSRKMKLETKLQPSIEYI